MTIIPITQAIYPQIAQIYQEGLDTGIATFETLVPSWEKWDAACLPFARIALENEGIILGWGALKAVSSRPVYRGVAEVSVYIAQAARGNGVGKLLLHELILQSEVNGIWTLQSSIFKENTASRYLHKKCGFREIGYRERIAQRNGVWYDNILMERRKK